jgi:two-component system sensor histidine kinase EvgS
LLLSAASRPVAGQEAARKEVRSGCEVDYPPFCIVQADGSSTGFSVELMQAALGAMDREVTFRTGPWAEVRGWLERGEIDALPLVGRTPEREDLFDFTVPYLTMHGAIVVRRDTTGIRSLEDLRGKRVGVMAGDNAEEFLRREERGLEIATSPTFAEAFQALAAGHLEAVVIQRLVALRLLAESGLRDDLRIVEQPVAGFGQEFCFAVREGDRETLALLNEGLALVVADGTQRRLHAKWFARLELPSDRPVVVGGDHNYPPFEFLDDRGRPTGFAVELTRAIAHEMGMDVQFRLGPWERTVDALEKGEIDAVEGMFYSPERDRVLAFSPRYLAIHCVGVVRRGSGKPPATLDELAGRDLVVQAGDAVLEALEERGIKARITTVDTQEDVVREVADGRHEWGLATRIGALHALEKNGWSNLEIGRSLYSGQYCYAVRQGQDALLAQFADGLRALKDSGEYQRIYDKWLGTYESGPRWHEVAKYVSYVTVPLLVIAALAVAWSWTLRRLVVRRTAELAALSNRHQTMLAEIPDIIAEVDRNKVYTWANQAGFAFFGDDLIGHKAADFFVGNQTAYQTVQPLFDGDENLLYLESQQRRRDGETRLLAWWCRALKDGSGTTTGALSTARDITDHRLAEERLRRSEALLNTTQRIAKIGGWEWDVERAEMFWTEETYRIHGINPAECPEGGDLVGTSTACYCAEGRERVLAAFHACVETGRPYELESRFTTVQGQELWIRTSGQAVVADGRVVRVLGDLQDITEYKRAENELARVAREWQTTFDAARDVIWLLDRDHRVLRANRTTERIFGRTADECVGKLCWEIVHNTAEPCPDCPAQRARRSLRRESLELPMGDLWIEVTVDPVLGEGGEYAGAVHAVRDITAHRRQEETVRRLNHVLRAIRDVNQLIVRETCPDRLIQAACDLLVEDRSYTAALVVLTDGQGRATRHAQTGLDAIFPPLAAWIGEGRVPPCCAAAANGEGIHIVSAGEPACDPCPLASHCPRIGVICARMVHDNDLLGFLAVSGSAELGVDEEERNLFLEVAGDLGYALHTIAAHAARLAAEEARDATRELLLQAQKMESVGRLAGGVAHDFNNKLMTIMANAQLCQLDLAPEHPVREYVDEIVQCAEQSASLTRQLLAFARKQTIEPDVLDLNDAVAGMMKLLQRLIGENIRLVWKPGPSLWPVLMDPSQLDQILANLAVNARDAIGGPGMVTVETANLAVDKAYAARHADAEPGDYVTLTVADDGCGMGEEVLGHLFEPFFTTKEMGKGTGLGLATVYGIVRQNRGFITVASEPGKGSTFKMHVPRCLAESGNPGPGREEEVPAAQGETVLLVEDEEALLRSTSHMLSRLGYRVLAAASAARALELAAAHPDPIHLLLTDVVMPETNGRELRDRLAALRPALRSVFMSGYTAEIIAHEGVLEKGVHFLQKPFTRLQLGRKLREVLDKPAG